jgi:hypothetical protein
MATTTSSTRRRTKTPAPTYPYTSDRVAVGDVIRCPQFAHAERASVADPKAWRARSGRRALAPNAARGRALYLVEEASMSGGTPIESHDYWPNGWQVVARRLRRDRSYDPSGETMEFAQTHPYDPLTDVAVVGRMDRQVLWTWAAP